METIVRPRSIRLIYWITIITFWIYVTVTVLATFFVGFVLIAGLDNLQLHVGLPVLLELKETGTLDLALLDHIVDVQLVELSGKVHIINTPIELGRIYAIIMFMILLLFLYIFVIIKRFITNVYNGIYFNVKNINLLKRISYSLVGVWIFTLTYGFFQYFFLAANMNFDTVEFNLSVNTYSVILLIALIIWVLSHIFAKGVEIKEENQLTV